MRVIAQAALQAGMQMMQHGLLRVPHFPLTPQNRNRSDAFASFVRTLNVESVNAVAKFRKYYSQGQFLPVRFYILTSHNSPNLRTPPFQRSSNEGCMATIPHPAQGIQGRVRAHRRIAVHRLQPKQRPERAAVHCYSPCHFFVIALRFAVGPRR